MNGNKPCQTDKIRSSVVDTRQCDSAPGEAQTHFLSFFLLILARSNFDHYARECNFGILKKKQKQNKKTKTKQKNLSAVFLTK